jgi:hypothetical protein
MLSCHSLTVFDKSSCCSGHLDSKIILLFIHDTFSWFMWPCLTLDIQFCNCVFTLWSTSSRLLCWTCFFSRLLCVRARTHTLVFVRLEVLLGSSYFDASFQSSLMLLVITTIQIFLSKPCSSNHDFFSFKQRPMKCLNRFISWTKAIKPDKTESLTRMSSILF